MSYLEMALRALGTAPIERVAPEAQSEAIPGQALSTNTDSKGHLYKLCAGEVPVASPPARILTCFECPLHEHDPVNPPQGWGRCTMRNQGCYGLKPACSESRGQNVMRAQTDNSPKQ